MKGGEFRVHCRIALFHELPIEFGQLQPHEVEDLLCIFKDRLRPYR